VSDYSYDEKVSEICNKVIEVLKDYSSTEACNSLSSVLAAIISTVSIDEGIDYNSMLKDLFTDIRNITELHMKKHKGKEIKVKI